MTAADGSAEKRQHMEEAFTRYVDGESLPAIARSMGMSKSSISLYLHEIESRTGLRVLPEPKRKKEKRDQRGAVSIEAYGVLVSATRMIGAPPWRLKRARRNA